MPISASTLHSSNNRDRDKRNVDLFSCFYPPAVTSYSGVCIVFHELIQREPGFTLHPHLHFNCRGKHMSSGRLEFNSKLEINRTETLRHAIKVRNVSRGCHLKL